MPDEKLTCDPRGLIRDAYRIDGIRIEECRSIFLDWAIGVPVDEDPHVHICLMHANYSSTYPEHPMTSVLNEGVEGKPVTRQRRRRV